jgi:hypothetical protein
MPTRGQDPQPKGPNPAQKLPHVPQKLIRGNKVEKTRSRGRGNQNARKKNK